MEVDKAIDVLELVLVAMVCPFVLPVLIIEKSK